ncbi:hypothetical protein D1007_59223 [Hordeum vulgare]|nr:hypothetical protein D1007_59223 [Hordeum vulgare]
MALRQRLWLCGLCVLVVLLLQAAPLACGRSPPQPCYKTVTGVQSWCAGEFILALFDGVKGHPIKEYCCVQLACVREPTCASVLRRVCPPPTKYLPCPPHLPGHMDKIVNIHYVDKEAFMNVDIVDKYEEVLTFLDSPTYEEVVAETRIRLKWVDPSDQVELLGRYDVGSAHKCRMKTMPIKSNLHWVAYREVVASSIDKSLKVFASTVVNAPLHVDLNQPLVDDLSPYNGVAPIVEHKVEVQVNEYPQYEFGGSAPI